MIRLSEHVVNCMPKDVFDIAPMVAVAEFYRRYPGSLNREDVKDRRLVAPSTRKGADPVAGSRTTPPAF